MQIICGILLLFMHLALFTRHSRSELARYLFYCMFFCYPPFARRVKGEVFVLLYVCLFVRSTISQQPAGRFTPYFACGRSLGRDVSSPLLEVSDPRGGK